MKKLPKLYARGNKDQILEWIMEVDGNKYRTITGAETAKKVESKWTIVESGKNKGRANETTKEEQALLEAQSKWEKKKKTGYFENIKDIDNMSYVEPMLANDFDDVKSRLAYPVMVDRKYNGMRQICTADGPKTRKGESIDTAPHVYDEIKKLFVKYPDLVIDGELYNHDFRHSLNDLMSIVRKTKNIDQALLDKSEKIVRYYVYDGYNFDDVTKDTSCLERRKELRKLLSGFKYIIIVPYIMAANEQFVYTIYDSFLEDGYEGAIVRNPNATYQNKRTNDLLKMKPCDDDEFEIVDIEEGTGNWAGAAKRVIFRCLDSGKTFAGGVKGNYDSGKKVLQDKKTWIGKTVSATYNGMTGLGTPNYAQFDPKNCNKGDR